MAGNAELAGAGEGLREDAPQAPASPVVEPPRGEHSEEIIPEEEEAARQAPASPPASALPRVSSGRQQQSHGHLDGESHGGLSRSPNLHTVTWANNWGTAFCALAHPGCAQWVYGVFFVGGIVLAWSSRDVELYAFTQRVNGFDDDRYLLGAESALRVSLAFLVFFTVMLITTVWTKKVYECRNFWNSNLGGPLLVKIAMLAGCLYMVQFPPSPFIQLYGNIARAGAWLYLAIQLISVTKFIMRVNTWQRWRWLLRAGAILSNFGSFGFVVWLLHKNKSNIVHFVIASVTLLLMVIMTCVYLKSEVTTGWLAPGLMLSYIVFMCWTVITSEPHRESTKAKDRKGPDWLTILSLVVMACSTLTAGRDEWLQFGEEVPSEDNIPYGFGYFHLVFALGSMYVGMIFVGWNAHQSMQRWTLDVGWWSAVVRAVNGLLAAFLYIWMLRTPFIWNKTMLVLSRRSEASWVTRVTFL